MPVDGHGQRPRGGGRHHRGQAHGSRAEDRDGVAGAGTEGGEDRPGAGEEAAAERSEQFDGQRGIDPDGVTGRDHRVLGERGLAEPPGSQSDPGRVGEPCRILLTPPEEVERGEGVTVGGGRAQTAAAVSAGVEAQHDMVADAEAGVRAARLHHDPGPLVAEHRRQR